MMKIGFDLHGTDKNLENKFESISKFISSKGDVEFVLYSSPIEIKETRDFIKDKNIKLVECKETIENTDGALSVRRKAESSMVMAVKDLVDDKIDVLISSGATGPLVTAGFLYCGPIFEDLVPALASLYQNTSGKIVTALDLGAKLEPTPKNMLQFAQMGSIYSKSLNISKSPKIRLLNIGEEPTKGNTLQRESYKLLKQNMPDQFLGNCEGNDILTLDADVLLTDAFGGNVALKALEGAFNAIKESMKKSANKSPLTKIGLGMAKTARKDLKELVNTNYVGTAIVLGLNKVLIKAHGASTTQMFYNSLNSAYMLYKANVIKSIKELDQNERK